MFCRCSILCQNSIPEVQFYSRVCQFSLLCQTAYQCLWRVCVLIAPGLIKNTVYKGVCCFDSPGLIKIQFIKGYAGFDSPWFNIKNTVYKGYAVLIAPGLIKKIQFIKGYAVLIAITPTLTACNLSMLKWWFKFNACAIPQISLLRMRINRRYAILMGMVFRQDTGPVPFTQQCCFSC